MARHFLTRIALFLVVCSFGKPFVIFASPVDQTSGCTNMLMQLRARATAQPTIVELQNPGRLLVHNAEFVPWIAKGYSREFLEFAVRRLGEENSFHLPLNQNDVMVAAPKGIYSRKGWDRDHLRGAAAEREVGRRAVAQRMTTASLKRYGKQWWRIVNALKNINAHPDLRDRSYVKEGHQVLPQVVFDPIRLDDLRTDQGDLAPWSVQKDAWGLYLNSAIDDLTPELQTRLNQDEKLSLAGMFALMVKIDFWNFATADAWEEENQIFTGGLGLVTSALERLAAEMELGATRSSVASVIDQVVKAPSIDETTRQIVQEATSRAQLNASIDNGYRVILEQLNAGGESPKRKIGGAEVGMGRTADLSLLWLFVNRLKRFTEQDYAKVLSIVETLVKKNGVLRYQNPYVDGYLNAGYFFGDREILPREMTKIPKLKIDGIEHLITGDLVRRQFFEHRTERLEQIFDKDFSAEWPLGLAMLLQAYVKMVKWFPDSASSLHYRKQAQDTALRLIASLTPGSNRLGGSVQERAIALDGSELAAYRFAEAIIPLRIFTENGEVSETLYSYSPFTQLNWCAAEALSGLKGLWDIEFPDRPFPLQ